MDPQAAWDELMDACENGDWELAQEHAENLLAWLQKGGFPPYPHGRMTDEHLNRAITEFVCKFVLNRMEHAQSDQD